MSETNTASRNIAIAIVASVVLIGFLAGVRTNPSIEYNDDLGEEESLAPTARSHAELAKNPWRENQAGFRRSEQPASAEPVTTKDVAAYKAALAKRAKGRAFEGAPPTIPHPVSETNVAQCIVCHQAGTTIGTTAAPVMPHALFASCTQCHAPGVDGLPVSTTPPSFVMRESDFVGQREAPAPWLMAPGSPPQIPHTTFMRENCQSCHGVNGRPGLQTSHPERRNCQQCHVPSAKVNQQIGGS